MPDNCEIIALNKMLGFGDGENLSDLVDAETNSLVSFSL